MPAAPRYPSLCQINSRVWLRRLAQERGRAVTLADIDSATIDGFARQGFDWIWLLSVWQTGPAGRAVSRGNPAWRAEFKAALPDLTENDICGSGFAITGYAASEEVGGDRSPGGLPREAGPARHPADAGLRAQPHGDRSPVGRDTPGILCSRQRSPARRRAAKLPPGRDRARPAHPGVRPRSQFSGMARYAAARLCQSRPAARQARRAPGGGRQMRRRALRHGDAAAARCLPAHLGHDARAVLAGGDRGGATGASRLHLHGRGLLGSRMDAAAAGLRLLLRQAAV